MGERPEMLTLGEAAERYQISRVKIWRWVRDGKLVTHRSERDLREKLVSGADIEALLKLQPIDIQERREGPELFSAA